MIPTQKMISNLIQIELAYINTSHPDFIGGKQVEGEKSREKKRREEKRREEKGIMMRCYVM